jgi:hypothetical protein
MALLSYERPIVYLLLFIDFAGDLLKVPFKQLPPCGGGCTSRGLKGIEGVTRW